MPRSLPRLLLALALACAVSLAQAQSSDKNIVFANVEVPKAGQYACAKACKTATFGGKPGFVPLEFKGVTACAVKITGGTGYVSGTMRQKQGCNVMNYVGGVVKAFRVAAGFQCLCTKSGTAQWAQDGDACPANHEQRGACRAVAGAQVAAKGTTVFGLIDSNSFACRYSDRAAGKTTNQLWLASGLEKYQVLCIRKS